MAKHRACGLPAETHLVQLLRTYLREIEARANGALWKARIVLRTADALFRYGEQQFAVAHDAGRRIMHLRVINPER